MTPHQSSLLEQMQDQRIHWRLGVSDREAIKAALDERAELLAACEAVLAWWASGPSPSEGFSPLVAVAAAVSKAKGGMT